MLGSVLALAGCGADPSALYLLPEIEIDSQMPTAATVVEVGTLDLPSYVLDNEISLRDETGVLRPVGNGFWADAPDRALTELLASTLDQSLTADVAAEPIPFNRPGTVRVDVRVRQFVGVPGQSLQLSGQYFLTAPNGGSLEQMRRFEVVIPTPDETVSGYAQAQSGAIRALAQDIAATIAAVRRDQL